MLYVQLQSKASNFAYYHNFFTNHSGTILKNSYRFAFTELTFFYEAQSCNVLDLICLSKLLMSAFFKSRSTCQNCQCHLIPFNLRSYKKYTEVDSWY